MESTISNPDFSAQYVYITDLQMKTLTSYKTPGKKHLRF